MIGRKGATIKKIAAINGCAVWVNQNVGPDHQNVVRFRGDPVRVQAAIQQVHDLIASAPATKASEHCGGNGDSLELECPAAKVRLLIGKCGWNLRRIMKKSRAHVLLIESPTHDGPARVIISGDHDSVLCAKGYICQVIDNETNEPEALKSASAVDQVTRNS